MEEITLLLTYGETGFNAFNLQPVQCQDFVTFTEIKRKTYVQTICVMHLQHVAQLAPKLLANVPSPAYLFQPQEQDICQLKNTQLHATILLFDRTGPVFCHVSACYATYYSPCRKGKTMSQQLKQKLLLLGFLLLIFLGCQTLFPPRSTATPVSTSTAQAAPTNTPPPASASSGSCNADETLKNLKSAVSYDESVLLYNKVEGTSFLIVWFMDPAIDPLAKESEITENTNLAIRHALIESQELKTSDPCVSKLFTVINAIVVDKNYNGWLSGQINITDLPSNVQTDDKQLAKLAESYEIGYLRNKVTAKLSSAPAGSCTWVDTSKNIQNHFSSERENIGFYFVQDDNGVNVWAQWDSQPDFLEVNLPASLLNVSMEVECLHPQPGRIMFTIVDETGEIRVIGLWNWADAEKQDISQIQILYQK